MKAPTLDLWMNGLFVGTWSWTRSGTSRLAYDRAWVAHPQGRALSLSLPITATRTLSGPKVTAWFDNLLPDSEIIRGRLATRHRVAAADTAGLLAAIGRDCVGALQLIPHGTVPPTPGPITGTPLTAAGVAARLRAVPVTRPFGGPLADDDLRISIAGAQEKTALLWHEDQWWLPTGATPTTHILKLPLGTVMQRGADFTTSVDNEWICLRLLRALGLPTATATIAGFADAAGLQRVLVVERFDRRRVVRGGAPHLLRLPQEDGCQATGTPSAAKYENVGGPSLDRLLDLLHRSQTPADDVRTVVLAQLAFWLLCAPDGHAKNVSLFLLPGTGYRLTPLYDVLSAWPVIGPGPNEYDYRDMKLAMSLPRTTRGRQYEMARLHVTHCRALAHRTGVPDLFDQMVAMVTALPDALHAVHADAPDDLHPVVWQRISDGAAGQAARFQRMLAVGPST